MPVLNPALRDFWNPNPDIRIRTLYGGRSSSKSWDAAAVAIILASNYQIKFLCVRQFQARVTDSVYTLLKQTIHRLKLGEIFDIQRNKIICKKTKSEFVFYGLWRHIEEIRGMEGIGILWIEEAHLMTKEQWQILEPTIIRNKNYQIWVVFNPRLTSDFTYQRFVVNPPKNSLVRKINYLENPFLNQQAINVIEELKKESLEDYEHFYLGFPLNNDDDSIIKRSWVMASIDAHLKLAIEPSGRHCVGFDVADSGADKCSTVYQYGFLVKEIDLWKGEEDELLKSCARTHATARKYNATINYDSIGVGAGCGSKFKDINREIGSSVRYSAYNAAGAINRPESFYSLQVKNKDAFANSKSQEWQKVADKFKTTYNAVNNGTAYAIDEIISLSSDLRHLDLLIDEITAPRRDYDGNGRMKVEKKEDMKKRGISSPNIADALIMANVHNRQGFF